MYSLQFALLIVVYVILQYNNCCIFRMDNFVPYNCQILFGVWMIAWLSKFQRMKSLMIWGKVSIVDQLSMFQNHLLISLFLCASCRQIERVRKESEESERMLKERLQRVDAHRLELEDELSRCKMNMASERLITDEQLASTKQRIRTEEVSPHLTVWDILGESFYSVVLVTGRSSGP